MGFKGYLTVLPPPLPFLRAVGFDSTHRMVLSSYHSTPVATVLYLQRGRVNRRRANDRQQEERQSHS